MTDSLREAPKAPPAAAQTRISVWSDYVCPFCYLELPELERLKAELGDGLEIEWRAFELRPDPQPTLDPDGEYLHRVWNASVYPMSAARGMALKLPPVQPRSRLALEAAEYAKEKGAFAALHRAIFRAFFEDGRDIGDIAVLRELAQGCGLDPDDVEQALGAGRFTAKVLEDQSLGGRIGVSGVPALVIEAQGRGMLVPGAQPYSSLKRALEQVWSSAGRAS